MQDDYKNRKKGGSPWVALAVMLGVTVIGSIENGSDVAFLGMLVVILALIGAIVAVIAIKKKTAGGAKTTPYQPQTADPPKPRQSYKNSTSAESALRPFSIFTRDAKLEEQSFSDRKADAAYDYGRVNQSFSHDQQRRLQQLDSFLKNGLIEREEYQIMRERYLHPKEYN